MSFRTNFSVDNLCIALPGQEGRLQHQPVHSRGALQEVRFWRFRLLPGSGTILDQVFGLSEAQS
jgi:hypothetical protein